MAGDYYRGRSGDLMGIIKKGLSIFGGPIGSAVSSVLPTPKLPSSIPPILTNPFSTGMKIGTDVVHDALGRPRRIRKDGKPYKRPTMNPANPKALRRALRREARFIHLAQATLRGTGYHISRAHRLPSAKKKR